MIAMEIVVQCWIQSSRIPILCTLVTIIVVFWIQVVIERNVLDYSGMLYITITNE